MSSTSLTEKLEYDATVSCQMEFYHQTIQSLELEQQEYQKEISKLHELNTDLEQRNSTLMEDQEYVQRDIHVMQFINHRTSQQLEKNGELQNVTKQKAQIAADLLKENVEIKTQNTIYRNQIESMAQKIVALEQELKNTKSTIQIQQIENKELDDKNQILQQQVSHIKLEQKYLNNNKSMAATPINPIARIKNRQSLRIVSEASLAISMDFDMSESGNFPYLYRRDSQDFVGLKTVYISETIDDETEEREECSEADDDYDTMIETLNYLNEEVEILNVALSEKDIIIQALNKEILTMKASDENDHLMKKDKLITNQSKMQQLKLQFLFWK